MTEGKKRLTIGLLVSGIMDDITKYVCRGVLQEARAADVNVVIFPGKYWERDLSDNRELMYEYQYNTAFSYARKENVDALIISAGSIGCFASKKSMEAMLKQYDGIPSVLIASKMDGYVSVGFDNYQGIREGLEYLIRECGCRHFGMIGGSLENSDAYERKQAFKEVLSDYGIMFKDTMYAEGDFTRRCTAAYRRLLDENPQLEAVFCVNDDTAFGLYEELQRRGLQAGKDIFVMGYDDTLGATKANPTLSSVRADSSKLGEEALKMAVGMAKGEKVESRVIATQFIKRDSFADRREEEGEVYSLLDCNNSFEDIFYRYCHDEMEKQMERLKGCYKNLIDAVSRRFAEKETEENRELMHCMEEFIHFGGVEYADVDKLLSILEELYRSLRNMQTKEEDKFELRNVFSSFYRKIIRAMDGQIGRMNDSKEAENYSIKLFVQDMLQFEKGRDQSYGTLLENLDWLNIKNACIYMLPEPILHLFKENFETPKELYMKAVLQDKQVETIPVSKQRRGIGELFSEAFSSEERLECVLLPLFFKETVYGLFLCDITDGVYVNGEFLINQVSSAIKMISLLRANEQIQLQLEENLAALKEHNIELDTISKSDVMTGILNRRGFYGEAEKRVEKSRKAGTAVMAVYVDMNNLKIINDRYGHKEGDHSIILIGRFLKELVGEKGVAGRIGGDEFACIMEYDGGSTEEEILSSLYHKFEVYNIQSDKPYNVTVSAGACLLGPEDSLTLKEALMQADEKLYEVKKLRKKDVAKNGFSEAEG